MCPAPRQTALEENGRVQQILQNAAAFLMETALVVAVGVAVVAEVVEDVVAAVGVEVVVVVVVVVAAVAEMHRKNHGYKFSDK